MLTRVVQVRLLQQAKDAFAGGLPQVEDRSIDIAQLKKRSGGGQEGCGMEELVRLGLAVVLQSTCRYEGEVEAWRGRYEEVVGETDRARQRAETLG